MECGKPQFQEFADRELERLWQLFPLKKKPIVEWKPLRVSAGLAYFRVYTIRLSYRVLKTEAAVKETLGHEYAHLLAYDRYGQKGTGHGAAWQQAMRDVGLVPTVRHNHEVERNEARQVVVYSCAKCGETFLRKRKFQQGRNYLHVKCGGALKFKHVRALTEGESDA